jgi:hypothetical protein
LFQPARPDYPEEPDQEPDSKRHKAEYKNSRPPPLSHASPSQQYPTLTIQPARTTYFIKTLTYRDLSLLPLPDFVNILKVKDCLVIVGLLSLLESIPL